MRYIDITQFDVASCNESTFILDTNVLLYVFYPNSSPTYAASYSNFVAALINNKKKLCVPMFYLCEAFHVIEKTECKLYNKQNHTSIKLKDYREIPAERSKVKGILRLFLDNIKNIPEIVIEEQTLVTSSADTFIDNYDSHSLDYFDLCLEEFSDSNGYPIITNDKDFINGVFKSSDIYTSNPNILAAASSTSSSSGPATAQSSNSNTADESTDTNDEDCAETESEPETEPKSE